MHYAKTWQIVAMTIIWAVILITFKNVTTQPEEQAGKKFEKPQIHMFIQHVGCSESRKNEVQRSLQDIAWLDKVEVKRRIDVEEEVETMEEEHERVEKQDLCTARVVADVVALEQVDFMQLMEAVSSLNLVPAAIEFGGLPRFGLQVQVYDLGCESCESAALDALLPLSVSPSYYLTTAKAADVEKTKLMTFRWLDKKEVNVKANSVTAFVRDHHIARVDEVIRALTRVGLVPLSIRVVTGQV